MQLTSALPHRVRITLLLLLLALLGAIAAPRAEAAQLPDAANTLAGCVQDSGRLLVAIEVDRSRSLRSTDPEDRRVDGISAALIGLERLASDPDSAHPPHVEVLLGSFAGTASPASEDAAASWHTLNAGSLDGLLRDADAYGRLDHGRDTDYALALIAAHAALDARAAALARAGGPAPCKAILFLSDGRYELTLRSPGGPLPLSVPYAGNVRLDKPGGPEQAVRAGREVLCRRGGLMDRMVADDVVLFTVALSSSSSFRPADRDFLHALTVGASGAARCGERVSPLTGWFVDVRHTLDEVLVMSRLGHGGGGVDPPAACTPTTVDTCSHSFDVARGMSGFVLVASGQEPGLQLDIESPAGTHMTISPTSDAHFSFAGTTFVQRWIRGRSLALQARFVGPPRLWAGRWRLTFVGAPDETLPSPRVDVRLEPGIQPAAVEVPELTPGRTTYIPVQLVDENGDPVREGQLVDSATLSAWLIRKGHAPLPLAVDGHGRGRFTVRVEVPHGFEGEAVSVRVETHFSLRGAIESVLRSLRFAVGGGGPKDPRFPWGLLGAILGGLLGTSAIVVGVAAARNPDGFRVGLRRVTAPLLPPWRRRARGPRHFPAAQRVRVLALSAEVTPDTLVAFAQAPGETELEPLPREEASERRIAHEDFVLAVQRAWSPFATPRAVATDAEGRQLVGGTLDGPLHGSADHRSCEVPLSLEATWLFAVERIDYRGDVHGHLLLIDHDDADRGRQLLEEARTGLLAQQWDDFDEGDVEYDGAYDDSVL